MDRLRQYIHTLGLDTILDKTDFFTAPASTRWHGCEVGGLAKHSLAVAKTLISLTDDLYLRWQNKRSPMLIGLLHDVCKLNTYEEYLDEEGKLKWRYRADLPKDRGHGTLSVKVIEDWGIKLTDEERVCIKYHMGPWTQDIDESLGELTYSQMLKEYPNLLWVHTADMYASHVLGT